MYNFQDKTIREIALEAPLTIRVFENHKIDFCCGGRVPFTEACKKAGADPLTVLTELDQALKSSPTAGEEALQKSAAELIEHIVNTHHGFTRGEIERLRPLADKVFSRHGDTHPELAEIRDIFHALADELLMHMRKEEMMLFPYIERLERAADTNGVPSLPPFGTVNNPVRMMIFEHDQAGDMLRKMRLLSSDYTAPEGACPSYKGLYAGLEYLEADLHRHIHLENNILFPQAIDLEKQIFSGAVHAAA
jgi:regulator of cell morphogenesis and NO signaling